MKGRRRLPPDSASNLTLVLESLRELVALESGKPLPKKKAQSQQQQQADDAGPSTSQGDGAAGDAGVKSPETTQKKRKHDKTAGAHV